MSKTTAINMAELCFPSHVMIHQVRSLEGEQKKQEELMEVNAAAASREASLTARAEKAEASLAQVNARVHVLVELCSMTPFQLYAYWVLSMLEKPNSIISSAFSFLFCLRRRWQPKASMKKIW